MALFDIPQRNTKAQDMQLAKRSQTRKTVAPTVKGGGTLLDRIATIKAVVEKNLGQYKDVYQIINEQEVLHDFITECIGNGYIAIDTETDGLEPLLNTLAGICPYTPGQKSAYIPINHISYITNTKASGQLDIDFVNKEFKRLLAKSPYIDMFNAKFDIRFLRASGLKDIYCTWDAYIASRLLNENEPKGYKGLKALHNKYCLDGKGDAFKFDALFSGIPFTLIPYNIGYLYAAHDPEITYELCEYQRQFIREDSDREDMRALYWDLMNIEMPCVPVVADMEDNGILFDMNYQQELSVKYHKLLDEKLRAFYDACDMYKAQIDTYRKNNVSCKLDNPINVASTQQLAILFYDILDVGVIDKKSPRGTGEEILSKIDNPVAKAVLEYRSLEKLVGTYIDKLPNCVNPNDGRIHCSFNQYGADTGRMSSQDPNLQNIPSHNKDIRKMFVASPGYVLMSSDYSQQEPSCLATFCKQAGADALFNARFNGNDLYSEVASACFNVPYEECCEFDANGNKNPAEYKARRNQAKPILLGILYGRGDKSVAEQLNCSLEEAQQLKLNLFKRFPEIQRFERDSLDMARDIGYVTTVCGRKRRLPDLQLDEYEFVWKDGISQTDDLLDFDEESDWDASIVPYDTQDYYYSKLKAVDNAKCKWNQKTKMRQRIYEQAKEEGIEIINNGKKIADATRQCVNSRIQGSAADLTKYAMIKLNNNERLKELGFRLLIPVHDEVIAECPEENVKECSKLLAEVMSSAAEEILKMPFSCDVEITRAWYGEAVNINEFD